MEQVNTKMVEGLLYGICKSIHNLAGSGAPAIMRQAGPDVLAELQALGVDFACVDNIEHLESKLNETMVAAGLCDKMEYKMEGNRLKTTIRNCAFYPLTMKMKEEGIPPIHCPFSMLTIAIAEKNLGKRARVIELKPLPGGNPGDTYLEVELV